MQSNEKLLALLNHRLSAKLAAITPFMVHSYICDSWGYGKLQTAIEKQAMDEMFHAELLIKHIIHLGGTPTISKLNTVKIGETVLEILTNDEELKIKGFHDFKEAIDIAHEAGDDRSAALITKILKTDEGHVNWTEKQLKQIRQIGLEKYLSQQTEGVTRQYKIM